MRCKSSANSPRFRLALDEAGARALAPRPLAGQRDRHCRVHCFRAGVGEEYIVEVARGQLRDPSRQLERLRAGDLEMPRAIELVELSGHGLGDFLAAVAGGDVEQPGAAVDSSSRWPWSAAAAPA